jgi:hypothetical protein
MLQSSAKPTIKDLLLTDFARTETLVPSRVPLKLRKVKAL